MIVRESIFEAVQFQRGVDPKSAMSLGLEEQIKQWIRDNYDQEPGRDILSFILGDEELDDETKEKWSLFLISRGYDWDYEDWAEMVNKGIDFISVLPDGYKRNFGDLDYFKKNGKHYIQFDGWENWIDYIEDDRDFDKKAMESILAGDAYEVFDSDYMPDVADSVDWILRDSESVKMIGEKFLEIGGDPSVPEKMMEDICNDDAFEELKDAISYALANSETLANESEAYRSITKALKNHFDIGEPEWNGKFQISEISSEGFRKILEARFDGNEKLDYSPPYYGYQGDISYDVFQQELENRLADI